MIEQIIADLHCHTSVSEHAYSTVLECMQEAIKKGLKALAITDHGPAMMDGAKEQHFRNLRVLPREYQGLQILYGAELNIVDYNGNTDLCEDTIKNRLDFCIASFHDEVCKPRKIEDHTRAYLELAKNPRIAIIGHSGTKEFVYDYEKVIPVFKQYGKVVEINEASFHVRKTSGDNCKTIALLCKKYGVKIAINTDSHFCTSIGIMKESLTMLNQIDFPKELVINSSLENLEDWLYQIKLA